MSINVSVHEIQRRLFLRPVGFAAVAVEKQMLAAHINADFRDI